MNFIELLHNICKEEFNPESDLVKCYHMSDDELYIDDIKARTTYRLISRKNPFGKIENQKDLFENFITDFTNKEVKAYHINGAYFLPGSCDYAIIFSSNLNDAKKSLWAIKGASYFVVEI